MENECIEKVWEQYKPLVYKIALKYVGFDELDDLVQEGFIGLYKAFMHYDKNTGSPFVTYAPYWIRQSIQRYIENSGSLVRIPTHAADSVRRYKKTVSDYEKQFGRTPPPDEIRHLMGISEQSLGTVLQALKMGQIESMTAPFGEDEATYEDVTGNDGIENAIINRLDLEDMKHDVHAAVDRLPDREKNVINWRYFDDLTLQQVGELEGKSIESVRQCENKALKRLRQPSYSASLRCYMGLSDKQQSIAMRGTVSAFNRTWTSATEKAAFVGLGVWH